jgi:anthraniloyl-CoA monooxygenase
LYSAILLRKALPAARIEVYERNRPDDTFGWGVVFSDQTMGNFRTADPETHRAILANFHHWDDIAIHFGGRKLFSGGHGFCGIGRKKLLQILQERAHELGVHETFRYEVENESAFADADLIIAADGLNSRTRSQHADIFQPDIDKRKCRFIWLGTTQSLCVYLRLRADRARLVSDPRLPVQQGPLDRDRRDPRGNLAGARPRQVQHRTVDRVL